MAMSSMTGLGTASGGLMDRIAGRMTGRAERGAKVRGKTGPLADLYLSQLIPAALLVIVGVVTIWSASLTIAEARFTSCIMRFIPSDMLPDLNTGMRAAAFSMSFSCSSE